MAQQAKKFLQQLQIHQAKVTENECSHWFNKICKLYYQQLHLKYFC